MPPFAFCRLTLPVWVCVCVQRLGCNLIRVFGLLGACGTSSNRSCARFAARRARALLDRVSM